MKTILRLAFYCLLFFTALVFADSRMTKRIPQFSNDKVEVWKTIIYPSTQQILKPHRHERDRVLVAFDSGTLKIVKNKNKISYLKLQKNHAYYLKKDPTSELHTDENLSKHPISVMVIELKE